MGRAFFVEEKKTMKTQTEKKRIRTNQFSGIQLLTSFGPALAGRPRNDPTGGRKKRNTTATVSSLLGNYA